jgi:tRNA(Ile)-lysidine synthase
MDLLPDPDVLPKPPQRLWVAYSGGLDSTVLLHRLAACATPGLRAAHIHHGLQPAADGWVRHCRSICRQLGVPLTVRRVRVADDDPRGPEAAARTARYAALRALLREGDVLATAHHQDDQAETLLLRLLRGSGVAGMAAMSEWSDIGRARLWRPLLGTPRETLAAYARRNGLGWIEDPHNMEPRYARSYLRAEVLPLLRRHWPQARESLARAARLAGEAAQLLDELADLDRGHADAGDDALSVTALGALPPPRRHNLLRRWLSRRGWPAPSAALLVRLDDEVLAARVDAQPVLRAGPYEFRRYRDRLYVMAPLPPPPRRQALPWRGGMLPLPAGCGRLRGPRRFDRLLTVRFGVLGERLRLAAGGPSHALRNLYQERGMPPWVRERLPLIYRGRALLAVADLWLGAEARSAGLRLRWETDLPGIGHSGSHRALP